MTSTDSFISGFQHEEKEQKCTSIWICHFLKVGVRRVIFQLHQETSKKCSRLPSDLVTSFSCFDQCALCFINSFASLQGLGAECVAGTRHHVPVTVQGFLTWLLASHKLSFTCSYHFLSGCLSEHGLLVVGTCDLVRSYFCAVLAWISECRLLVRGLSWWQNTTQALATKI